MPDFSDEPAPYSALEFALGFGTSEPRQSWPVNSWISWTWTVAEDCSCGSAVGAVTGRPVRTGQAVQPGRQTESAARVSSGKVTSLTRQVYMTLNKTSYTAAVNKTNVVRVRFLLLFISRRQLIYPILSHLSPQSICHTLKILHERV